MPMRKLDALASGLLEYRLWRILSVSRYAFLSYSLFFEPFSWLRAMAAWKSAVGACSAAGNRAWQASKHAAASSERFMPEYAMPSSSQHVGSHFVWSSGGALSSHAMRL